MRFKNKATKRRITTKRSEKNLIDTFLKNIVYTQNIIYQYIPTYVCVMTHSSSLIVFFQIYSYIIVKVKLCIHKSIHMDYITMKTNA